jgi:hypothetical protein
MRTRSAVSLLAAAALAAAPTLGITGAGAHPATATYKCRTQTYSYTQGAKQILNSIKGPKVRTKASGQQSLTDNRILASFAPQDLAKYLNITTNYDPAQKVSRLESVTLYPKKGHKKTFKIVTNPNKDYVYKYDLLKARGQVQVPTTGSTAQGRATPKLTKVVVKAKENCFATQ